MNELRTMVVDELARTLEKTHDTTAKLNDDLRFLRGVDLDDLNDEDLALLKKLIDSLGGGFAMIQVMLEVTIVKKLKEDRNESL